MEQKEKLGEEVSGGSFSRNHGEEASGWEEHVPKLIENCSSCRESEKKNSDEKTI